MGRLERAAGIVADDEGIGRQRGIKSNGPQSSRVNEDSYIIASPWVFTAMPAPEVQSTALQSLTSSI
jgi:hypothetical protein